MLLTLSPKTADSSGEKSCCCSFIFFFLSFRFRLLVESSAIHARSWETERTKRRGGATGNSGAPATTADFIMTTLMTGAW